MADLNIYVLIKEITLVNLGYCFILHSLHFPGGIHSCSKNPRIFLVDARCQVVIPSCQNTVSNLRGRLITWENNKLSEALKNSLHGCFSPHFYPFWSLPPVFCVGGGQCNKIPLSLSWPMFIIYRELYLQPYWRRHSFHSQSKMCILIKAKKTVLPF